MTREFSCDAGRRGSPDRLSAPLHLNEAAPINGERPPIGGLRLPCFAGAAASQATTAVGAHFISGGTSFALGRNRSRGRQGRAPDRAERRADLRAG
jgi:hypothetical protein